MEPSRKTLSQKLAAASTAALSIASGVELHRRIRVVLSLLSQMRARRFGMSRVLESVGARFGTPRGSSPGESAGTEPTEGGDASTRARHHSAHTNRGGSSG